MNDSGQSTSMSTAFPTDSAETGVPDTYSMQHADTGDTTLVDDLATSGDKTKKSNEEILDAHTKIAGESARWICVRNHVSKLANTSFFYTAKPNADGKVLGVSFKPCGYLGTVLLVKIMIFLMQLLFRKLHQVRTLEETVFKKRMLQAWEQQIIILMVVKVGTLKKIFRSLLTRTGYE